ncbi:MAG: hypothetical protein U0271_07770 [Polyangiaceae bacterium]
MNDVERGAGAIIVASSLRFTARGRADVLDPSCVSLERAGRREVACEHALDRAERPRIVARSRSQVGREHQRWRTAHAREHLEGARLVTALDQNLRGRHRERLAQPRSVRARTRACPRPQHGGERAGLVRGAARALEQLEGERPAARALDLHLDRARLGLRGGRCDDLTARAGGCFSAPLVLLRFVDVFAVAGELLLQLLPEAHRAAPP